MGIGDEVLGVIEEKNNLEFDGVWFDDGEVMTMLGVVEMCH